MHLQIQRGFSSHHIRQTNSLNLLTPTFLPLDWVKSGFKLEFFRETKLSETMSTRRTWRWKTWSRTNLAVYLAEKFVRGTNWAIILNECQNHSMAIRRCEKVKRDVTRWLSARDWPEDLCWLQMNASLDKVYGVLNSGGPSKLWL